MNNLLFRSLEEYKGREYEIKIMKNSSIYAEKSDAFVFAFNESQDDIKMYGSIGYSSTPKSAYLKAEKEKAKAKSKWLGKY